MNGDLFYIRPLPSGEKFFSKGSEERIPPRLESEFPALILNENFIGTSAAQYLAGTWWLCYSFNNISTHVWL